MADATGISWADATFNPWIGCEKVSPGCAHCYALDLVTGRMGRANTWGPDGVRQVTSDANWRKPLAWARLARDGKIPSGKDNEDGHRPRVFCASLADVFEDRPELEEPRRRLFDLIETTYELDWLVLTKRPEKARDWLAARYVPRNMWLGVSIENARFTWRADVVREISAAVRFISAEPLLGSLFAVRSSGRYRPDGEVSGTRRVDGAERPAGLGADHQNAGAKPATSATPAQGLARPLDLTGIDWIIVGGESGGRAARPMSPFWAREIRDACHGADLDRPGPALHMKQWGSHAPVRKTTPRAGDVWVYPDGHTETWQLGDADEDHDRDDYGFIVRPDGSDAALMRYAGTAPTSGGKMLDGVDWCEFPTPQRQEVPA